MLEVSQSLKFNKAFFGFHCSLLRSWFQRQQTCPTCRLNILRTSITSPQPQPQQQQQPVINNVRPNEPAPAAQPNPFFNLLNQQANPQTPPASNSTSTNPIPSTFPGAAMPPPFFFPSMPFMAPYPPPPPMPQNLEQLSVEELRAMEGHERQHVEERLKLLKNVQTMLNASAALMNQYQMVMANLPPLPVQLQSTAASSSTAPANSTEQPETSAQKPSTSTSPTKLEDVGSEDNVSELANKAASTSSTTATASISSTSSSSQSSVTKRSTVETPTTATSSSFIATESLATNGESEEANEIRKRRLQKFLQSD